MKDVGSKNGSWVAGVKLEPQAWAPISSGERLTAGHVQLTFYLAKELLARLGRDL